MSAPADGAQDALEDGQVELLVEIAPVSTPTPSPSASPSVAPSVPDFLGATGGDPTGALLVGGALLIAGTVAFVIRRSRTRMRT